MNNNRRKARNSHNRRKLMMKLSEEQNHRCCYCGTKVIHYFESESWQTTGNPPNNGATFEHVLEYAHGGLFNYNNLVMACRQCNTMRSREIFNPHHQYLSAHPICQRIRTMLQEITLDQQLNNMLNFNAYSVGV